LDIVLCVLIFGNPPYKLDTFVVFGATDVQRSNCFSKVLKLNTPKRERRD
jgi:hypothetical protein